jgi:integrase
LQEYRRASREHGAPVKTSGIPTMGEFAAQWLDGLRLAPSTVAGYRKIVRNHIAPQLGSVRLDHVTVSRLKAHYSDLLRGGRADAKKPGGALSSNTVSKIHVVIGSILDAAVEDSYIPANPARRTKAVGAPSQREAKRARPELMVWTVDQLRAFLDWNRNMMRDDLYPLWVVYAKTGMRRSEALALRWEDIDLTRPDGGGRIAVRRAVDPATARAVKPTKTYRERAVDIDPARSPCSAHGELRAARSFSAASTTAPTCFPGATATCARQTRFRGGGRTAYAWRAKCSERTPCPR